MHHYINPIYLNNLKFLVNMKFEDPAILPEPRCSFGWEEFKNSLEFLKINKENVSYIIIDTI